MKKFLKLSALFAVMSVLFLGCQEDGGKKPGPKPDGDKPVQSIKILVRGSQESNPPLKMLVDDTAQLSAQILPGEAKEKGYTFELLDNDGGVLSLSETNLLTAVSTGQATIKVTSKGQKADGSYATDTLAVVVTDDPNTIQAALVVYNQNATPDAATTTALPALNANNRYVIVNNEADATLPSGWTSVAGNTIVYLNKPIKMQREVVDETTFNYTPFSISARVRITGGRTSGNLNDTANCLVTGIFTNPTIAVSATTPLYFVGMRHAWNGQKRMYASRDSDNSAAAFSTSAPDFDKADTATDKKSGFQDQEYVIKVERTTGSTYTISAYKADGTTLVASNTRGSSANQANAELQKDEYYYLGFIISGVTVEISNVVIMDGTEKVFEAATNATPDTVAIKKVNITADKPVGAGGGVDYSCVKDAFPATGVQLSAKVIPTDVSQTVTWSISTAGAGATVTNGLVKITGAGAFTVKAQSIGDAFSEFKFNILDQKPAATGVNVTGAGIVTSGDSITLKATVAPELADQTVTWSVTASDNTTATTAATINATTGVLTAATVTADTIVHVFATTTNSIKSAAHAITVKPLGSGPELPQIWHSDIGIQSSITEKIALNASKTELTMKGTGAINSSGQAFNYIYLDHNADTDFTMIVKINNVKFGAINDASRIGIMAASKSSVDYDSGTGIITTKHATAALNAAQGMLYSAVAIRPNATNINWSTMRATVAPASSPGIATGWSAQNFTTGGDELSNVWIRLQRRGGQIFGSVSINDGTTWSEHSQSTANLPNQGAVLIGLFVGCNPGTTTPPGVTTATFSDLYFGAGDGKGAATITIDNLDPVDFAWLAE